MYSNYFTDMRVYSVMFLIGYVVEVHRKCVIYLVFANVNGIRTVRCNEAHLCTSMTIINIQFDLKLIISCNRRINVRLVSFQTVGNVELWEDCKGRKYSFKTLKLLAGNYGS